ncbi:hypothetical protein BJ322DRAFT_1167329 [Thelephora terrestris]|uniref:BTB domain-containing protein n=1 Tax=Thelephora terrestris TaxID=56493 RepID=A0A9P6H5G4_9AGAM|nr:hypothetical protein BJ322DRAFT_1167329 [Thelephora terrestris]
MFPPHPLRSALTDAVVSGVFIDTKFYLFSRRSSSGKVCRPRPLYANSLSLKSVPYFDNLLSGGFAEGVTKSLDHDPFEDSDQAEDYDYLSDSDLEDDAEITEPVAKIHESTTGGQNSSVAMKLHNELNHQGKVVVLRGVSYLTFQAIVMYLYTGEIDFAPFGSKANRELRTPEFLSTEEDTIPRPSPKSIYRIADMYDLPKLKEFAYAAIRDGIGSCDAVEETFSKFTSRYQEMVDLYVENLASALLSPDSQDIRERLNEKLRSFTDGEIPHAANVVSALFDTLLARYRASENPSETSAPNIRPKSECAWAEGGSCYYLACKVSLTPLNYKRVLSGYMNILTVHMLR